MVVEQHINKAPNKDYSKATVLVVKSIEWNVYMFTSSPYIVCFISGLQLSKFFNLIQVQRAL